MEILGLKEIEMYFKLFKEAQLNEDKKYSQTDIGRLIDEHYPNTSTHQFIKKLIVVVVLVKDHTIEYKGKYIDIYKIDYNKLLEIIKSTKEYEMLKEIYDSNSLIRVLRPGAKE